MYFFYCFDVKALVPDGICVTSIAMRNHINENNDLASSLNNAIQISKECNFEQLSDNCKRSNKDKLSIQL